MKELEHLQLIGRQSRLRFLLFVLLVLTPTGVIADDLTTYGFFDLEMEIGNKDGAAKRGTFDQHHLTLIWQKQLDPRFSVLFETSYEHGPNLSDGTLEGKIYLPKAYCEYMRTDVLILRMGKFLPPFGIYNERHDATPTVIPTVLPQSVYGKHLNLLGAEVAEFSQKVRAYPRYATGLWTLGTAFKNDWEFDYHAYVTNGRGDDPSEKDDNANKGFGSRFVVTPPGLPSLGFSYYSDRNGSLDGARQNAFGTDLEFSAGPLFIEAGSLFPELEGLNDDGRRNGSIRRPLGGYIMAGFTLWDRTTPFAYLDRYDPDRDTGNDAVSDLTLGVNHMLANSVFIKSELHLYRFQDAAKSGYWNAIASLAVAF